MAEVTYKHETSREYPHIEWLELNADGILHECAIMRRDPTGNVLFFKTNDLDEIDKRRLAGILMDRNARSFELWDLMAQKTLGNGMNALSYFHQLVRQLTPNGRVLDPRSGQIGGQSGVQATTAVQTA
ncbi:MAG: hypothetical protein CTY12_00310 [Methylotenera sp.]|nr:MAG: hypothetical protein CTY12_00310 [Methylotenera sp.]